MFSVLRGFLFSVLFALVCAFCCVFCRVFGHMLFLPTRFPPILDQFLECYGIFVRFVFDISKIALRFSYDLTSVCDFPWVFFRFLVISCFSPDGFLVIS